MIKIILALVVLLGIYVGWHLWRITPFGWPLKTTVLGLFLVWMASTFVGFAFMERIPVSTASVLYQVGCTWLIAFLYLVIVFLVVDIATLLSSFLVPHFSFLIPHSSFLISHSSQKNPETIRSGIFARGAWRIRTAVDGFADR